MTIKHRPRFIPIARRGEQPSIFGAFTYGQVALAPDSKRDTIYVYGLPPVPPRNKARFVYRYKGENAPNGGNLVATYVRRGRDWVKQ